MGEEEAVWEKRVMLGSKVEVVQRLKKFKSSMFKSSMLGSGVGGK
jgi:hypothetical protein